MQTNTQTDTLEVKQWKTRRKGDISIWDPKIIRGAIPDSFKKLDPRVQIKNPVMFVVEVGSVITTIEFVRLLFAQPTATFTRSLLTSETIFVLAVARSEEHTSELQSHVNLVCRLLLEKKK